MESETRIPLAERLRPHKLSDVVGQKPAVELLQKIVVAGEPVSLIFWGPPGTGKTTLARIFANELDADFIEISAVTSGKKDVENIVEHAKQNWNLKVRTILFVDEIHRFNKAQQDAFLPHVESGLITLIGATTENPSFEVISPLISRSRVIVLQQLSAEEIKEIILRACEYLFTKSSSTSKTSSARHPELDSGSSKKRTVKGDARIDWIPDQVRNDESGILKKITPEAIDALAKTSTGDARSALGTLEVAAGLIKNKEKITEKIIEQAAGQKIPQYDKKGDGHYDTISAFIKSMRGGDTDAALFYLARMVAAGEDPKFIARRMVIFASEDIGLAGNGALGLALNCFMAIERIGMPESGIILSHVVVALTRAQKSRESYDAWAKWQKIAAQFPDSPVPIAVRNAPTKLMKNLGFGKNGKGESQKWQAGFHLDADYLPDEVVKFLKK